MKKCKKVNNNSETIKLLRERQKELEPFVHEYFAIERHITMILFGGKIVVSYRGTKQPWYEWGKKHE